MNNFVVEHKLNINADEAIVLVDLIKECHRLCHIIDLELENDVPKE